MEPTTTILYIDDSRDSQRLARRVLERAGYRVLVADSGFDGITTASRERPQLILMDMVMPGMDGQEVTTRLRSIPELAGIPIVALTGQVEDGSREQALVAGCAGFLTKPIDVARFPRQIDAFLRGRVEPLPEDERNAHLQRYVDKLVRRLEDKVHQLESANRGLRELDRMKSDFLVLVSHELRAPLAQVMAYADLIAAEAAELAGRPALAADVVELRLAVTQASRVLDEIIRVFRLTSGQLELAVGPVRLDELVGVLVTDLADACHRRRLTIAVTGLEALPAIEADELQLATALENVLGNAVKYTPDGGRVTVHGARVGDAVHITVRDAGIGVPAGEQERIFDLFHVLGSLSHHASSKVAFAGGGLGLGLPISRGIIEAHGGCIWLDSAGRDPVHLPGCTVHIVLPVRQPPAHGTAAGELGPGQSAIRDQRP
jgi:signal transduction histidine kinase